ncbi:MAG: hypothetical protein MJ033_03330 [Victivallaceae bacterium]|nr:hypothetical protein [Victivallaceae bacterium]
MGNICGNNQSIVVQTKTENASSSVNILTDGKEIHIDSNAVAWKIWEQLYNSRELEITTLWQRSIFLSAFIILLLTGSGVFYFYSILSTPISQFTLKDSLTSLLLGSILMISGTLWLAMSKGSKYWTEIYERKIDILENILPVELQFKYLQENYVAKEYDIAIDGKTYHKDKSLVKKHWFCFFKADSTSPSTVNCWIGIVIVFIGLFFIFIPYIIFCCENEFRIYFSTDSTLQRTIAVLVIIILLCVVTYFFSHHKFKPRKR